jgi:hypothetical protein
MTLWVIQRSPARGKRVRGVSTIADVENILTPANAQSGEFVRAEVTVKRRINFSKSLAGLLLYCPFT